MKLLVTAFEPFGGDTVNASQAAVSRLPAELGGASVVRATLPVVFGRAEEELAALVEREQPDLVVCVGEAGGATGIQVERLAVNLDDARIPDNAGLQPRDEPVVRDGPAAYFSTLPVRAMAEAVGAEGLPASVSLSAGTFLCNHAFYALMHLAATRLPSIRGGFVHVPLLPEQAARRPGCPSMAGEDTVRGLTAALAAAVHRLPL